MKIIPPANHRINPACFLNYTDYKGLIDNIGTSSRKTLSVYRGVGKYMFYNKKKPWVVRFWANGKKVGVKYYKTQNEAAIAFNEWIEKRESYKIPKTKTYKKRTIKKNHIVYLPITTEENKNWFNSRIGRHHRRLNKEEAIQRIIDNTTEETKDDNELIISFINGDDEAFGKLFAKYYSKLVVMLQKTNNRISREVSYKKINEFEYTAADSVSDAFIIVRKRIKDNKFMGFTFPGYVFKTAYYNYIKFVSKKLNIVDWKKRNRWRIRKGGEELALKLRHGNPRRHTFIFAKPL